MPAGFAGLTLTGPFAWNGFVSFWVRNIAIALWIVVMAVALRRGDGARRATAVGVAGVSIVSNLRTDPKRELWFAWYSTVAFYSLYSVVFFVLTRTQPPGQAVATAPSRPSTGSPTATGACSSGSR